MRLRLPVLRILCLGVLGAMTLSLTPLSSNERANQELRQVFQKLEDQIRLVRFPNGLRLILLKQGRAPVAAVYMKFLAGSADESPETYGVAHMLEHMLFKGTKLVGTRNWKAEQKYHWLSIRWMEKLDNARRKAERAHKNKNKVHYKKYMNEVRKYRSLLDGLQRLSRTFVISEEDSRLYSENGGRGYNAYTMSDLTNYQIELPANRLEVWARIESDRMQNAVLRDFYPERQVVAEERAMRYSNSPARLMYEKLIEKAYGPHHPYGHSVIGPRRSILYLNYNKAMKFYKTYYAPNNAVIAIIGNIDLEKTESLVRKYFAKLPSRSIPNRRGPAPFPQNDLMASAKSKAFDLKLELKAPPGLVIAYRKPPMPDPADARLSLLSDILTSGQESRLFQRLVIKTRLAAGVSSFTGYPGERYENLFIIQVTPRSPEYYDQILSEIENEISEIRAKGVRPEELRRIQNKEKADLVYRLRSNSFLADQLSYFEILFSDYKTLFRYYKQMESITPKDIQLATKRYLKKEARMTVRLILPKSLQKQSSKSPAR